MGYYATFEQRISDLTLTAVNSALKQYIKPQSLVVVTAGDFRKPAAVNVGDDSDDDSDDESR